MPLGVVPIALGQVVSRIWAVYRERFAVLFGAAVVLYGLQFVIDLLVPASSGVLLVVLFWTLGVVYQGVVVQLVRDLEDGRRDHGVVVAISGRLADARIEPIPDTLAHSEEERLDRRLAGRGGALSGEQREAIALACSGRPLVVIEGHAGAGKSTTLAAIARAHQADGRQIIVTSTAALAAQRLAGELAEHGVQSRAYSTAGLHAALRSGRLELSAQTTVIHDEAALASTKERLRLLRAVERSGARLIEVGDPRQSQPVGAGGLWDHIQHAIAEHGGAVELTHNQRAHDPADRDAQALFRQARTREAVASYATRKRIHTGPEPQPLEDLALEAAQQDRADGKSTLVVAQTSNEHLDELNARAQAIRTQHGELGRQGLDISARPYSLHAGDEVQVRRTLRHPDAGQLRNGTTARVADIDPGARQVWLELTDGAPVQLDEQQIEQADLRLAYVQHPFPAQGQTTDTAHLIVTEQTTREGAYVAITRARD